MRVDLLFITADDEPDEQVTVEWPAVPQAGEYVIVRDDGPDRLGGECFRIIWRDGVPEVLMKLDR